MTHMTGQERRTKLATDKQLDMYWKVILGLEGLSAVIMLMVGFAAGATGLAFGGIFGFAAALVWIAVILVLAFIALVMWGVYNIERWVVILMWIGAIGSVLNLFGHFNWNNLVQVGINVFVLYAYRKILEFVSPKTSTPS